MTLMILSAPLTHCFSCSLASSMLIQHQRASERTQRKNQAPGRGGQGLPDGGSMRLIEQGQVGHARCPQFAR